MSTRRKVGVSTATTESARRQLMAPVACWERQWVKADANATFKVYKWVKTDKPQNFDDDEGGVDEPLAPLPDEPEVIEDDEEAQDETAAATPAASVAPPEAISRATSEPDLKADSHTESKAPSPKPHPLSMSFGPDDANMEESGADATGVLGEGVLGEGTGVLGDASVSLGAGDLGVGDADTLGADGLVDVGGLDGGLSMPLSVSETAQLDASAVPGLDMSALGPDGEPFEGAHELSQMQPEDALLGGGQALDDTVAEDPFAMNTS